jgi:hypothetical protein
MVNFFSYLLSRAQKVFVDYKARGYLEKFRGRGGNKPDRPTEP